MRPEPGSLPPCRDQFSPAKPAKSVVCDDRSRVGRRAALPSAERAMALIELEATSFNLEFHLSAEAMATHRLLMPVRRGAIAHSEFVEFGEHFGLVRPEILEAPLSLDAVHTAIAHSEEWLNGLHKLFPKIG